eukprot:764882-Hanusia_phi.AAC.2
MVQDRRGPFPPPLPSRHPRLLLLLLLSSSSSSFPADRLVLAAINEQYKENQRQKNNARVNPILKQLMAAQAMKGKKG